MKTSLLNMNKELYIILLLILASNKYVSRIGYTLLVSNPNILGYIALTIGISPMYKLLVGYLIFISSLLANSLTRSIRFSIPSILIRILLSVLYLLYSFLPSSSDIRFSSIASSINFFTSLSVKYKSDIIRTMQKLTPYCKILDASIFNVKLNIE
jgi:hypothetical protein